MVRRTCVRAGLLALVAAAPVGAQTNDAYWSVWTGREERLSARAQALGGAAVALIDDSAAAATNPAILATLRRSEVVGGYTSFGRSNFGTIGGGGLLKGGVALGGYVRRPTTFSETDLNQRLEYELTEGGVTAAGKWGRVEVDALDIEGTPAAVRTEAAGKDLIIIGEVPLPAQKPRQATLGMTERGKFRKEKLKLVGPGLADLVFDGGRTW